MILTHIAQRIQYLKCETKVFALDELLFVYGVTWRIRCQNNFSKRSQAESRMLCHDLKSLFLTFINLDH